MFFFTSLKARSSHHISEFNCHRFEGDSEPPYTDGSRSQFNRSSTVASLFKKKHLQRGKDMCYNFIDFKKAFGRDWHNGLWYLVPKFNIEEYTSSDHSIAVNQFWKLGAPQQSGGRMLSDDGRRLPGATSVPVAV